MSRPPVRCTWATSEAMVRYHDEEWGVPLHDDHGLFEFLILEGAQAGLSWETILKRRSSYRTRFSGFEVKKVARYTAADQQRLLEDPGIIRNRLKIRSAISNAQAFLEVQKEFGSFDAYIWRFTGGRPQQGGALPRRTHSAESDAMSADLRRRGFSFVGTTICYAFMQAIGMVNDHAEGCFRRRALSRQR